MNTPPELAPRLAHNKLVRDKWLTDNKVKDYFPSVETQVEIVPLNLKSLRPYAYNPSVFIRNGTFWMAYRYHPDQHRTTTQLAIARLEEHGVARESIEVNLNATSAEDPRVFMLGGVPHLSWVDSDWTGQGNPHSVVKLGALDEDMKVLEPIQPQLGHNDWTAMEKNWTFFDHEGHPACIYTSRPTQIVYHIQGKSTIIRHTSPMPPWIYGEIRGGAVAEYDDTRFVRFFHSGLDNEDPPWSRRYYVGACLMEKKPPFRVTAISRQPIVRGSSDDGLSDTERAGCYHYKGRVAFPGGAVRISTGWLLSLGVNDCACVLAKITDLKL